jgi:cytochrome c2
VPTPTASDIILGLFSRDGVDYKFLNLPYDRTKSGNQILFEMKCGRCHHLDKPLSKYKTFEEWDATTLRMRAKLPVWISEEERKSITYYLAKVRGKSKPKDIPETQALFENKCSRCHSIDRPLYALKPLTEWPKIIERMRNKAPGWITEEEAEIITSYLVENIKARRIELSAKRELSDEQALFEVKCSRCHVLDRPLQTEDLSSDNWAETVMRMREKAPDWISMEEAKKIIEYLIRL